MFSDGWGGGEEGLRLWKVGERILIRKSYSARGLSGWRKGMSFAGNKRTSFSVHLWLKSAIDAKSRGPNLFVAFLRTFRVTLLSVKDFGFGVLGCCNFIMVVISLFVAVLASPANYRSSHPTSSISDRRKRSTMRFFWKFVASITIFPPVNDHLTRCARVLACPYSQTQPYPLCLMHDRTSKGGRKPTFQ